MGSRRWGAAALLVMMLMVTMLIVGCADGESARPAASPEPATAQSTTGQAADTEGSEPSGADGSQSKEPDESNAASACPGVTAGVSRFELSVGDNTYPIRLLAPTSRDGLDGPLPVVLNWHGLGSNGFQQAQLTGYETLAEQEGFLVVHPTGLPATASTESGMEVPAGQEGRRSWELAQLDVPGRDDVAMASALIDRLVADYCGDESRIYSTGMSNGGFFTSHLVCELSDRLAAAVSVAGLSHPDTCRPERPVPFMAFHGTADEVVPYAGGDSSLLGSSPAEESAPGDGAADAGLDAAVPTELREFFDQVMPEEFDQFALSFGCRPEPETDPITDDVTVFRYAECGDQVPLVFHRIDGGGHTWPGSPLGLLLSGRLGQTTFDVSATTDGWEFMSGFRLDR